MPDPRLGRREFVRLAGASVLLLAARTPGAALLRAAEFRCGLALRGDDRALAGARLGVREAVQTARLLGSTFTAHEAVIAAGAAAADAATRLIGEHGVQAIVGGSTPADADAIAQVCEARQVLFLNAGSAREALRHGCGPFTFHVAPSNGMRIAALGAAGVAATPDARALSWHPRLERFGAGQVSDRYEAVFGERMTERAWEGWMAVKILLDASQRAGGTGAAELARFLTSRRAAFDGHKGMQLSFEPATRQLRQPLYVATASEVLAEVPVLRGSGDVSHADLLDALLEGGTPCAP